MAVGAEVVVVDVLAGADAVAVDVAALVLVPAVTPAGSARATRSENFHGCLSRRALS